MMPALDTAATLADLAASTPIIIAPKSPKRITVTAQLLDRLTEYARTAKATDPRGAWACAKVLRRVSSCRRWPSCGTRHCPRCATDKAIQARHRLEARLAALPPATPLRFVTLTVLARDLGAGWRVMVGAFATLRQRALWRNTVAGGSAHYQIQPATRAEDMWLPHAHVLAELRPDSDLDGGAVADHWQELLAREGMLGSSDVRLAAARWDQSRGEAFSPLAYYVTRALRSEWLVYPPPKLATVVWFVMGRRLSALFGTWWGGARHASAPC